MASQGESTTFWLGGAVAIGLVMGLVLGFATSVYGGVIAGVAAAGVWFIVGALRRRRAARP
ncbi:hypothetical protein JQS43_19825 [Natronosporangium hydrolyticum]|uniref:Uncharacterized protein n=1 Tax=Natronosporangium hydrolyticum TaxID=2811111 RepID=A0A895YGX9_9ACTN|nr:hypothetical protein [Natronosporangium hydrolyticum]QSB13786.1 hypothetical protein JQS43_19825 [Natronosporangium hydrolyticum]